MWIGLCIVEVKAVCECRCIVQNNEDSGSIGSRRRRTGEGGCSSDISNNSLLYQDPDDMTWHNERVILAESSQPLP